MQAEERGELPPPEHEPDYDDEPEPDDDDVTDAEIAEMVTREHERIAALPKD